MKRKIRRPDRALAVPQRQIKRRSQASKWIYNYDYDNEEFLQYFRSVTGIQVGLELKRTLSRFLLSDSSADHWLRTSKNFSYIKSKEPVSTQDREDTIRWHKLLRDGLQEIWNEYTQQNKRKIRRR